MVSIIVNVLMFVIVIVFAVTFIQAQLSLAPWVPTRSRDLERINRLADLKPGSVFYEIGCGTAAVSAHIARQNPQGKVVGIELAFPIYLFARVRQILSGCKNLHIEFGDALLRNYADAGAVYIFGLPESVNGKLKTKLEQELESGAKFISYVFTVNDWKGSGEFVDKPDAKVNRINVYVR